MSFPKAKFSQWYHWDNRGSMPNRKYPGVYLLARFKGRCPKIVNHRGKNVVYIGETCRKEGEGLLTRWRQFERAVKKNEKGHSGGLTYRKHFGGNFEDLYVSAWPVTDIQGDRASSLIRCVERKLLWDYVERWERYPKCNKM